MPYVSNEKIRFQSFFMLITVQPSRLGLVHQCLGERADLGIG